MKIRRRSAQTILSTSACGCLLIMVLLYAVSPSDVRYLQPFERHLLLIGDQQPVTADLRQDGFYIAGATQTHLYLGNTRNVLQVKKTDLSLADLQDQVIVLSRPEVFKKAYLEIDSPYFFIKDGNLPLIIRGNLTEWRGKQYYRSIPPFTQALTRSSSTLISQGIADAGSDKVKNVFCKIGLDSSGIRICTIPIEKRSNAYYEDSGLLRYNSEKDVVVFTWSYANKFLVLDRHLNLVYEGNTLDTIRTPRIKRSEISPGVYALASPPSVVNRYSCTAGNLLFIISQAMGRTEHRRLFDKASVVDAFDIASGKYRCSFYIPDYNNRKMDSFCIVKNRLFGIFGPHLVSYDVGKCCE